MTQKEIDKLKDKMRKAGDISFDAIFKSMQLLNHTVLFPYFDFEKEDMEKFQERITSYDNICVSNKAEFYREVLILKEKYDFDVVKLAKEFPTRAMIQIVGNNFKSKYEWAIARKKTVDAVQSILTICAHELTTNWGKGAEDLAIYWEKLKENAMNYANGMDDKFVEQYFKDYADLDITD